MKELPTEYIALVRKLHRQAALLRQPINGTFELTNRCNLRCRMCYVRQPAGSKSLRERELPASAWLSLAKASAENGMIFLLLTGGEIFLRQDFFDIYEPLTRLGLVITIYSNGTLITEEIAQRLAQMPPANIEVTLYGASAKTYESVTGIPGSYARCCAGIEHLHKHGVSFGLKTTLTRQNVNELEEMKTMARNWDVPFSAGWLLSKRRDGDFSDVERCRLSPSECAALEAFDYVSGVDETESLLRNAPGSTEENFYCLAGKASFVVTPFGEMNVCLDLPMPAADPLKSSFSIAWKQVQQFVDTAPAVSKVCRTCDAHGFCPRCPAWSLLETHTLTEPVEYLCHVASSRRQVFLAAKKCGDVMS